MPICSLLFYLGFSLSFFTLFASSISKIHFLLQCRVLTVIPVVSPLSGFSDHSTSPVLVLLPFFQFGFVGKIQSRRPSSAVRGFIKKQSTCGLCHFSAAITCDISIYSNEQWQRIRALIVIFVYFRSSVLWRNIFSSEKQRLSFE